MSKSFSKSILTVNGNTVHMSMPFEKVNVEKRTVSGFATLDNIDTQGDVVTAEASAKAFSKARGNVREMHGKIAAGRVIDFKEETFFHDGEVYSGIWVTAYISKGAPDTWEKVLDGTLSGFSIGGEINDASSEFVKEAGRTVRFIKDYDLTELSLVDNPANQLANVSSIEKSLMTMQKSATGSVTVEGLVVDTVIENVFICKNDDTVVVAAVENKECPVCETKMENAGWFESGSDRTEKVRSIVNKFLSPTVEEAAPISEGGVEMAKKEVEKSTPATEETPEEVPHAEPSGDAEADETSADVDETETVETPEAAVEVPEVEDESETFEKKIDELHKSITETLEANQTETLEKVAELEKKIDEVHESFVKKASELESKYSEFGDKLEAAKGRLAEFEKALDVVNSSEAVKKSADLEESPGLVQKSKEFKWGTGTFSGTSLFS